MKKRDTNTSILERLKETIPKRRQRDIAAIIRGRKNRPAPYHSKEVDIQHGVMIYEEHHPVEVSHLFKVALVRYGFKRTNANIPQERSRSQNSQVNSFTLKETRIDEIFNRFNEENFAEDFLIEESMNEVGIVKSNVKENTSSLGISKRVRASKISPMKLRKRGFSKNDNVLNIKRNILFSTKNETKSPTLTAQNSKFLHRRNLKDRSNRRFKSHSTDITLFGSKEDLSKVEDSIESIGALSNIRLHHVESNSVLCLEDANKHQPIFLKREKYKLEDIKKHIKTVREIRTTFFQNLDKNGEYDKERFKLLHLNCCGKIKRSITGLSLESVSLQSLEEIYQKTLRSKNPLHFSATVFGVSMLEKKINNACNHIKAAKDIVRPAFLPCSARSQIFPSIKKSESISGGKRSSSPLSRLNNSCLKVCSTIHKFSVVSSNMKSKESRKVELKESQRKTLIHAKSSVLNREIDAAPHRSDHIFKMRKEGVKIGRNIDEKTKIMECYKAYGDMVSLLKLSFWELPYSTIKHLLSIFDYILLILSEEESLIQEDYLNIKKALYCINIHTLNEEGKAKGIFIRLQELSGKLFPDYIKLFEE